MILQELRLHNFGLYVGEQVLHFSPTRAGQKQLPVTLFGGINGGGKTTILDALQLALYGPRAQCTKRADSSYDAYLSKSIHRGVPPREGAAVAVRFLYASDGQQQEYEVRRTWTVRDDKVRESLHVSKDGVRDKWLSENWSQVVEDLVPLGISQLFFFDAEKIRFLAEEDSTSEALGTAIKSLLGLDLAKRLITDAGILEARLSKEVGGNEQNSQIQVLEDALDKITQSSRPLKERRAALENDRLVANRDLERAETAFAKAGGHHWQQREARRQRLQELKLHEAELTIILQTLSTADLPLSLVPDLLEAAARQAAVEQKGKESLVVQAVLKRRDRECVLALRRKKIPKSTLDLIEKWQEKDRESRGSETAEFRLHLSDAGLRQLEHVIASIPELKARAAETVAELDNVRRAIEDAERSLAVVTSDQEIQPVLDRLMESTRGHAMICADVKRLDEQISTLDTERTAVESKLTQIRRSSVDTQIKNEESVRMRQLAARTQTLMQEFLKKSTQLKIERLSRYVLDSFRYLLRKNTLVESLVIDPSSFEITLYDNAGCLVPKERLSEGEKQIFAIAVLWGLARASTRPLPAIVDTPMARLDSTHRNHLIERYFPNASHQVIILSTDTEVDSRYYEQLQPHINRAYYLNYDEPRKCTVVEEGYFWRLNDSSHSRKAVL
jgi:DNA sulfur modification protein DndD